MHRYLSTLVAIAVVIFPLAVAAQLGQPAQQNVITTNSQITSFAKLVDLILKYINLLIPVLFGLTFVMLGWGVVNAWIINGGNSEKVEQGRMIALWGIIGLVVMVGLWAIIAIVRSSIFGTTN